MHWKAACLAGVCLSAFAALMAGATEFLASRAARLGFDAIAAHVSALKADQIIADPWRGEIRITGLSWDEAGASVHIGGLRLTVGPSAFSQSAIAQSNAASAEDVSIETALATFEIRRIELSGTSLTTAELAQMLASETAPIGERIAKISATAISIPQLVAVAKLGPSSQKIVYRDVLLTDVVKGKAAAASAEGASFSISDPELGETEGAYGRMAGKAVDLVLAARIMSGTRDDRAEPKTALYDSFAIEGFHLSNSKARFDLGIQAISGRGVKGRPLRLPRIGMQDSDQTPLEHKKRVALFYADVLDAVSVDEMDASDLRLTLRGGEAPASLSIGQVAISKFYGTEIDGLSVQNLAFETEPATIGFEGLAVHRLDLGRLQDALAKAPASNEDAASGANVRAAMPAIEEMVLTKLDVNTAGSKPGRESLRSAFKLARLEIHGSNQKDGAPTQVDAALDHMTFSLDQANEGAFKDLSAMGYSQLDLSSRIAMAWDESKQELAIGRFSLEGADMGTVQISGLLSNVTKDLLSSNRVVATVAALGVVLNKIDLRVENAGLFEKAIAAQAERQNKSIDEIRQTYARGAMVFVPSLLENGPAAKAIGAALAKFVAHPKNFHLVVAAPEGFGLSDLTSIRAPGALLKKLDIAVAANE